MKTIEEKISPEKNSPQKKSPEKISPKKISPEKNPEKNANGKEPEKLSGELSLLRQKLLWQQNEIKGKLPVLVLVEGWGTAGKGGLISKSISDLDPRFFSVIPVVSPNEDERRRPFFWRHFCNIPEKGKFLFLDSSWLEELVSLRYDGETDDRRLKLYEEEINTFERQLLDGGYVIVKLFIDISADEQKKRIEKLLESRDTAWRISKSDRRQNLHYEHFRKLYFETMNKTSKAVPWQVIDGTSRKKAQLSMFAAITGAIESGLVREGSPAPEEQRNFNLIKLPPLNEVSFEGCVFDDKEYKKTLDKLQNRLSELHNRLYRMRVPVVICYEGWDAAGKGGNIKRLTHALDARGFEVFPIAAPEPHELSRHYLWRFWKRLPKTGHIALFDRTWYGRVMVERIEGLCDKNDWKRAYGEINEFERMLSDWGAVVIKFWIHIDKDTQLLRFNERRDNPEKSWKITEEDWRNREKWDKYEAAVDEMLKKTSTDFAPWYIVESVDKKYARIKAIKIVIDRLERALCEEKE